MELRFIKYKGKIMLLRGITYNPFFDPPEVYVAVHLKYSILRSLLIGKELVIPLSEAEELTDKSTIKALAVLYGIPK